MIKYFFLFGGRQSLRGTTNALAFGLFGFQRQGGFGACMMDSSDSFQSSTPATFSVASVTAKIYFH